MLTKDSIKSVLVALIWVMGFQMVAIMIGIVTRLNIPDWYNFLNKSPLNPPNMVFPVVWTVLYVLIALAGWHIFSYRKHDQGKRAYVYYWLYVLLNWGWSFVFFGAHLAMSGFYWIVAALIVNTAFVFYSWPVSKKAALLMMPAIFWQIFAAYLNYEIWMLN